MFISTFPWETMTPGGSVLVQHWTLAPQTRSLMLRDAPGDAPGTWTEFVRSHPPALVFSLKLNLSLLLMQHFHFNVAFIV